MSDEIVAGEGARPDDEAQPEDITPAEAEPIEEEENEEEADTWQSQMLEAIHNLTNQVTELSSKLIPEAKEKEPESPPPPPPPPPQTKNPRKRKLF